MKKIINILNILIVFLTLFSISQASDYYQVYEPSFSNMIPNSLYVAGAACLDSSCTGVNNDKGVELYDGDKFITCWNNFGSDNNVDKFLTCVENSKISGNIADLTKMSKIVVKEDTSSNFGYITEFFASNDSYLPYYYKTESYSCEYDVCVDTSIKHISFVKKSNAVAEIGKLNIENVENDLFPIQVTVPVSLDNSICSAFEFTNPDIYRFYPPQGYSDYSVNTNINMKITNVITGALYLNQTVKVPIEADTCAGLSTFTWTPNSNLKNTKVKILATSTIKDNQISSSSSDSTFAIQTIYPVNLSGLCWSKTEDFTLSNKNSFDLSTSVAKITQGEDLYLLFKLNSFRENTSNPIKSTIKIKFNNTLIYSGGFDKVENLGTFSLNLTDKIKDLKPGNYNVNVEVSQNDSLCTNLTPVIMEQNLQIMSIPKYNVYFTVVNKDSIYLNNSKVELDLKSTDDYFSTPKEYSNTSFTDENGYTKFTNLIAGIYTYKISKSGYNTISKQIHIGSDTNVYVNLKINNTAPVINLNDNYTANFLDGVNINLDDYTYDFEDDYSNLVYSYSIISGNGYASLDKNILTVGSSSANDIKIKVKVTDSQGLSSNDTTIIHLTNISVPKILEFKASSTNIEIGTQVEFYSSVTNPEGLNLKCNIDFGDGNNKDFDCNSNVKYNYSNIGTYKPKLTVDDGYNQPVVQTTDIIVYENENKLPSISYFTLESSNDYYIPTNLTLKWNITNKDDSDLNCSLYINGNKNNVECYDASFEIKNFTTLGTSKFQLVVSNGVDDVSSKIQKTFFKVNSKPVIDKFNASSLVGIGSLNTTFNMEVHDKDNDNLICTLSFGDGNKIVNNCSNMTKVNYVYNLVGTYTPVLSVTDGIDTVYKTLDLKVVSLNDSEQVVSISSFTLNPTNNFIPANITFNWFISNPKNDELACDIKINSIEIPIVDCALNTYQINNFTTIGVSNFTLEVYDFNTSIIKTKTISMEFNKKEVTSLKLSNIGLVVDSIINPGRFNFKLLIDEENLTLRNIKVKPMIVCKDVINTLNSNDGILETSAKSSKLSSIRAFEFTTNTNDFKLNVPINDVSCRFKVKVFDNYGTDLTLLKTVVFKYPEVEHRLQSIRGKPVDVVDYMKSTTKILSKGYNNLDFTLSNNLDKEKELTISVIAQGLDISQSEKISLGPGQERKVQIPLLVKNSKHSGIYPVRFSVTDGSDKQVRYSYIQVE